MSVFVPPAASLADSRALFIHNWRCAGSTMNSLLSANFGSKYAKVGTQFTDFGWPDYSLPELLTVRQVRNKSLAGGVLGGHLCAGVESFVGGAWDLWINARKPEKRLSSGILRFHSSSFRVARGNYSRQELTQIAEEKLRGLASGALQHEVNGVAKRLAGFSVADFVEIGVNADLEKISCFSTLSNDDELLAAALNQLQKVAIVILPEYLHASIISIEKKYSLGPVINLFSDLRHNPVSLGKASEDERLLFEFAIPLLQKLCAIDCQLWKSLAEKFQNQINTSGISKRDVVVREMLHKRPVITAGLLKSASSDEDLIVKIADALGVVAKSRKEIAHDVVDLACRWPRFAPDAAEEIRLRAANGLKVS